MEGLPTPLRATNVHDLAAEEGLNDSIESNAPPRGILRRKSVTIRQQIEELAQDESDDEEKNAAEKREMSSTDQGMTTLPLFCGRNLIYPFCYSQPISQFKFFCFSHALCNHAA